MQASYRSLDGQPQDVMKERGHMDSATGDGQHGVLNLRTHMCSRQTHQAQPSGFKHIQVFFLM